MARLEVSVIIDEKKKYIYKRLKPRVISLQVMDFQRDINRRMFLYYLRKGNSQNKDKFFSKIDEF